ncbi:hypothetical protein [Pseudoalteromonas sp. 1181_04]|uniref:hypothetical protein n=1 Tax=Pseudoalteromonas sp. 1181_04 TaxID=2604450 RepID=UPI00406376E9
MQHSNLPKNVKFHIKNTYLPNKVKLRTQGHLNIIAIRAILTFIVPFCGVVGYFTESIFYGICFAPLFLSLVFAYSRSHYLVLDIETGKAYKEKLFLAKATSKKILKNLNDVEVLVQQIPGLADKYQIALCHERYTIGTYQDTQAAAAFLANHFGCIHTEKVNEFTEKTNVSNNTPDLDQNALDNRPTNTVDDPALKSGKDITFWDTKSLIKMILLPFICFIIIGLIAITL